MILIDTSVWVEILKDKRGKIVQAFKARMSGEVCALTRFTQLELLQGALNDTEWRQLDEYLSTQLYLEASEGTWSRAARIYFELRRKGMTVSSPIDCCIGQIAIESKALLLHRDRDFDRIAQIRPLLSAWFEAGS